METITRDEAFSLLKKYNKDPFHIQHALTVDAAPPHTHTLSLHDALPI